MALNLRKVELNNLRTYLSIVSDKESLKANQEGSRQTITDIEDAIGLTLKGIQENGRALLLSKIPERDVIYSSIYNSFIEGADLDLRLVARNIITLGDTVNRVSNLLSTYHTNILKLTNERISEIYNLENLADTNQQFNAFFSDSFTDDTNAYQLTDGAKNSSAGGMYRLGTFSSVSYVENLGDAYINTNILNQDITVISKAGSILSPNLDDSFSILTFSDKEVVYNGSIAGGDFSYPGIVMAVVINLPAKRLLNEISFSPFSSQNPEILGLFVSSYETTSHESNEWQAIPNLTYDPTNNGMIQLVIPKISAQSVMLLIGMQDRNITKLDVNPDGESYLLQQIESQTEANPFNVKQMYMNAMLESGYEITRKDAIIYETPQPVSTASSEVKRYLDRLIQLLRPSVGTSVVNGFIHDLGLYSMRIKYNEYRTFGIFESETKTAPGNIIAAQITKDDYINDSVFIKYFMIFETLTKRLLGINDTTTSDLIVVNDSAVLTYDLDFYGMNPENLVVMVNGNIIPSTDYTIGYGDKNDKVISKVTLLQSHVQFSNVIKIKYDIANIDVNYNTYVPSIVDLRKEIGFPNIKRNIPRDPTANEIVLIRNSGDTLVPLQLGNGIRRVNTLVSGEATMIYLLDTSGAAFSRIDSNLYGSDIYKLTDDTDAYVQVIDPSNLELPAHDIFYGIIDEVVASGDIISTTSFHTKYDYQPGSALVTINGKVSYSDSYPENATDLTIVTLRTQVIDTADQIKVTYIPINNLIFARRAQSNIATYNKSQTIAGTDTKSAITLSSYPFVDYRIVNDIKPTGLWANVNNVYSLRRLVSTTYAPMNITIMGKPATDITNYQENKISVFDPFIDTVKNYQYYVQGNRVFFNTPILEDIVVNYYTLGSRVKLRAELYRNNLNDQSNTPQFYNYGLLINTQQ